MKKIRGEGLGEELRNGCDTFCNVLTGLNDGFYVFEKINLDRFF